MYLFVSACILFPRELYQVHICLYAKHIQEHTSTYALLNQCICACMCSYSCPRYMHICNCPSRSYLTVSDCISTLFCKHIHTHMVLIQIYCAKSAAPHAGHTRLTHEQQQHRDQAQAEQQLQEHKEHSLVRHRYQSAH